MDAFFAVSLTVSMLIVGMLGLLKAREDSQLENKKQEMKAEICQRESKTAGEFEKCLKVKE